MHLIVMNKNNIEIIKHFFSTNEEKTLLINQINEEIGCFYELAIKEIASIYKVKLDKITDIAEIVGPMLRLFIVSSVEGKFGS